MMGVEESPPAGGSAQCGKPLHAPPRTSVESLASEDQCSAALFSSFAPPSATGSTRPRTSDRTEGVKVLQAGEVLHTESATKGRKVSGRRLARYVTVL
jgi:hypothetical protein